MCSQTRNSCAKAFDNRSRNKNLKPKKGFNKVISREPLTCVLIDLNWKSQVKVAGFLKVKKLNYNIVIVKHFNYIV